jgi:hypothetical protein
MFAFKLNFTLSYSYLSHSWRQIVKVDKFDLCNLLHPTKTFFGIDTWFKTVLKVTKIKATCPLKNGTVVKVSNYTDSEETASFLKVPPGNYRSSVLFYNDFDEKIFQMATFFYVRANSTEKYEFK